ncbi:MAG: cryptochrome/photolyase family protein [Planctomycetes bacterium]|nr:cryptochrome/photolyase family protein [Planctomycetota bacterium]
MSTFARRLRQLQPKGRAPRRWLFVPYDQLHDGIGPLAREAPGELGIVLVESRAKAARRPYHRQKLALVLANLRHFALEQAARGVAVRHVATARGYAAALEPLVRELGPLRMLRPAEHELRAELRPLVAAGALVELPHDGWLSTAADLAAIPGPPWRLDAFYRQVRRRTGVLLARGKPVGGKWSFDAENRQPWRGTPPAPEPPTFAPDAVTREVGDLVAREFAAHPGELHLDRLPASRADAERLWAWALRDCLPWFGPYEDAMSTQSTGLFHTRIAPLLNLHRLLPARVLADALAAPLPLPSQEGFVRQVLGWREFVHQVHEATDGLRTVGGAPIDQNVLRADLDLPATFWGTPSGLHCLDRVVADVWREGYSHHITRLMVLGNLATLLGVEPRQLTDWFWVAYTDAYDWVVEPNVLAMASYGVGGLMTTKPYVAGSAYLHRMGDYCRDCEFDPGTTCPITPLYWQFLARNHDRLAGNQRLSMPLRNAAKRPAAARARDAAIAAWARATLAGGGRLRPDDGPTGPSGR